MSSPRSRVHHSHHCRVESLEPPRVAAANRRRDDRGMSDCCRCVGYAAQSPCRAVQLSGEVVPVLTLPRRDGKSHCHWVIRIAPADCLLMTGVIGLPKSINRPRRKFHAASFVSPSPTNVTPSSDGNESRSRNLLGGRRRRLLISNLGRTTEASLRFGLDTKGGRLGQSIHHIATMD